MDVEKKGIWICIGIRLSTWNSLIMKSSVQLISLFLWTTVHSFYKMYKKGNIIYHHKCNSYPIIIPNEIADWLLFTFVIKFGVDTILEWAKLSTWVILALPLLASSFKNRSDTKLWVLRVRILSFFSYWYALMQCIMQAWGRTTSSLLSLFNVNGILLCVLEMNI